MGGGVGVEGAMRPVWPPVPVGVRLRRSSALLSVERSFALQPLYLVSRPLPSLTLQGLFVVEKVCLGCMDPAAAVSFCVEVVKTNHSMPQNCHALTGLLRAWLSFFTIVGALPVVAGERSLAVGVDVSAGNSSRQKRLG